MPALTFDDPLLRSWAFYSGLLMLKMLGMSIYTGATRMKHKVLHYSIINNRLLIILTVSLAYKLLQNYATVVYLFTKTKICKFCVGIRKSGGWRHPQG